MKICFYALRKFDELKYCEQYKKQYGIDYVYTSEYPSFDNVALAEGCEAVSMTPCDMSDTLVKAFHEIGVKYITCRSIGYDHVSLSAARQYNMRVSNVSYPPSGVANYAIMLMLMCTRRMAHIMKRAELQDYSLKNKLGRDISHCVIGIIGTGKIGATVARHLSGFGCKILAYDPYENAELKEIVEYTELETLLQNADIISLHMNATDQNYHMINRETIAKMKQGVILINTARGKLIDSDAVVDGIKSGKIGGAGLDVLENENGLYYYDHMGDNIANDTMAILRAFPNVILSPHTAFYTEEDVRDMVKGCFESVDAFEQGIPTAHEVKF